MVNVKPSKVPEYREVVYDAEHWNILRRLRDIAREIMEVFYSSSIEAFVHGSVARGDVKKTSDVDIFIPDKTPSYRVEYLLQSRGYKIYSRYIVMATPASTPKAVIYLDPEEKISVSFPLAKLGHLELDFFRFSGLLYLQDLLKGHRVPGVNKNLVFIEPTVRGHREAPVIGYEDYVAERLGVDVAVVLERVNVLTRRDRVGRTGLFVKRHLSPEEVPEEVVRDMARKNPLIRRIIDEL